MKNQEKYDKLVEIHEIKEFSDLSNLIKIEDIDLRENFIFRGIKKSSYDLIPSSLRKNKKGYYNINKFILNSEFSFDFQKQQTTELDSENRLIIPTKTIDKNNNVTVSTKPKYHVSSEGELHFKREILCFIEIFKLC